MLLSGSHNIDTGGVNGAVTQNTGQLGNVLFNAVKGSGKQLSQIVRKHLAFFDTGDFTQLLHLPPDAAAVQRLSVSADGDFTGFDTTALCIVQQNILQLARNENRPGFAFTA